MFSCFPKRPAAMSFWRLQNVTELAEQKVIFFFFFPIANRCLATQLLATRAQQQQQEPDGQAKQALITSLITLTPRASLSLQLPILGLFSLAQEWTDSSGNHRKIFPVSCSSHCLLYWSTCFHASLPSSSWQSSSTSLLATLSSRSEVELEQELRK